MEVVFIPLSSAPSHVLFWNLPGKTLSLVNSALCLVPISALPVELGWEVHNQLDGSPFTSSIRTSGGPFERSGDCTVSYFPVLSDEYLILSFYLIF